MARGRLTSLDASFLRIETPNAHMHVAWKGRFAPRDDGRSITVDALRASIGARLRHAGRFRQRLAFPTGGVGEPAWVDAAGFDVADHVLAFSLDDESLPVRRFDELCDLALSQPLDRARPLWEVFLAPRLTDGTTGLLMKVHHAMVDGKSAVALALLLLDLLPDAVVGEPDDGWRPAGAPSGARLALDAMADTGAESLRTAAGLARRLARPGESVRLASTLRRAALAVGDDILRPAPTSWINRPIGPQRTLVSHSCDVELLLAARRRLRGTLNDAALCLVSGALRELALEAGRPPEPLKVMVPVSRRDDGQEAALGNRIAFVFIELPIQLPRTVDRFSVIRRQTDRFKRDGRAAGGEIVLGAIGALPPALKDVAARFAASPRMYNLTISNVPGPRFPVYLLGHRLLEAVPVIPLSEGHPLSIGVFTHADRVTFGGYADPTALPEVAGLSAALDRAALELAGHARAPAGRRAAA
jgi:diacylglycerol O-acyltransferase